MTGDETIRRGHRTEFWLIFCQKRHIHTGELLQREKAIMVRIVLQWGRMTREAAVTAVRMHKG